MREALILKRWSYDGHMAGRPPLKPAPIFGTQLAALRKARGWTQPQLARKLGITLAALTHYERKAENPSAEFVSKVAKLFNVTADALLGVAVAEKQKVVLQLLDSFLQASGSGH
jgi:transcriptional regulator with XRE-family HTH domain